MQINKFYKSLEICQSCKHMERQDVDISNRMAYTWWFCELAADEKDAYTTLIAAHYPPSGLLGGAFKIPSKCPYNLEHTLLETEDAL